jgi:hypothetical protein
MAIHHQQKLMRFTTSSRVRFPPLFSSYIYFLLLSVIIICYYLFVVI